MPRAVRKPLSAADEREEDPEDDQADRGADLGPLDDAPRQRQRGACANVGGRRWSFGGLPGSVARDRRRPIPPRLMAEIVPSEG